MRQVAVLAGGRSLEHEVSRRSAEQVLLHLDSTRWTPWAIYIDTDGLWHVNSPSGGSGFARVEAPRCPGAALAELLDRGIDVVFPVLHGRHGEDGTVQGMLELHDMPFVGSGSAASAVAMDKIRTRECLTTHGVRMASAYVSEAALDRLDARRVAGQIASAIGFPCFLKLDLSGSSYGVARAERDADVVEFVERHRFHGRRFVAEHALDGEEISVPVLGNTGDTICSLPAIGIYPVDDPYFTPRAKYEPGASVETIPPKGLSSAMLDEVGRIAERCHTALVCDGMSRTDMIVTRDGPVVLEVNTIPGLTTTSLLPQSAQAAGIDFTELLDRLLGFALERPGARK